MLKSGGFKSNSFGLEVTNVLSELFLGSFG